MHAIYSLSKKITWWWNPEGGGPRQLCVEKMYKNIQISEKLDKSFISYEPFLYFSIRKAPSLINVFSKLLGLSGRF